MVTAAICTASVDGSMLSQRSRNRGSPSDGKRRMNGDRDESGAGDCPAPLEGTFPGGDWMSPSLLVEGPEEGWTSLSPLGERAEEVWTSPSPLAGEGEGEEGNPPSPLAG